MKRIKEIWKHFLIWIGAAAMLFTAGCAKALPADAFAQKNTEQVIWIAQGGEPDGAAGQRYASAAEQAQAPARLTRELSAANGQLTVWIDAPVIVPDVSMPVVRVAPAQFTQEQVTRVFQAFCGDTPMYLTTEVWTKAEIAESIARYREQLLDESLQAVDREYIEAMIAERDAAYESAPETKERVRTDGTLVRTPLERSGPTGITYMGVDARNEDGTLSFQARNDYDNTEPLTQYEHDEAGNVTGGSTVGITRSASILCNDYRTTLDGAIFGTLRHRVCRGDPIPEAARPYIDITPDEAYDMAERWLVDIGVSDAFAVADVFLEETGEGPGPIPEYYYGIICTRHVGGVPCAYLNNYHASRSGEVGLGKLYQEWEYERMRIAIVKDGFQSAYWTAPLTILETVEESAALKPFSEIEEIACKALPIIYEKRLLSEWVDATEVEIDLITLSLQRIVEQGQFDRGLLVPTWNFFGTWTDTRAHNEYDARSGSMLSINAVDGSIIDVVEGY